MPSVTSDVAVLRLNEEPAILLVRRKDPPFKGKWALPGGFMEICETLEETARRELMEETGISAGELIRFDTYDRPDRDPRGRTITQLFVLVWEEKMGAPVAGSDADRLEWFGLQALPELAFDHAEMIRDVIGMLKNGVR